MSTPDRKETGEPSVKRSVNPAIGFGTSFAAGMAILGLGGHWLDVRFGREPLFTLLGIFMGLAYGGWELWKLAALSSQKTGDKKSEQEETEEKHHDRHHP